MPTGPDRNALAGAPPDAPAKEAARQRLLQSPTRVALALVLLTLLTRLPALLYPKTIDDERVYSVVAGEILHGEKPYLSAVERKPPLLFYVYAGILKLAGPTNWPALHLAAVAWTLATMAVLYLIARRLFDTQAGLAAAMLYGLFLAWADYRDLAFNGEMLMNLPAMAAFAVALAPSRSRWRPELALAGALVVIAFLLKQPSGITAGAIGLYLLLPSYRRERGHSLPEALAHAGWLTLGFVAAFAVTGLALQREGILHEAIYWTVLNHRPAYDLRPWAVLADMLRSLGLFAVSTLPLLLAAGASAWDAGLWQGHRAERAAILLLLAGGVLGVATSGQYLYHYNLQLIPPLALLAAPAMVAVWRRQRSYRGLPRGPVLAGWLAVTATVFLVVDTVGLSRHRGPGQAASWVRAHSTPDDRLFVWGQGTGSTGMYLEAERRPASRYIASFPLTGHYFGPGGWNPNLDVRSRIVPGAWDNLREDFSQHPPRYIIDTDAVRRRPAYPIEHYAWLHDYLAQHYRRVAREPDGVVYERVGG
jgi:hypothetical protein